MRWTRHTSTRPAHPLLCKQTQLPRTCPVKERTRTSKESTKAMMKLGGSLRVVEKGRVTPTRILHHRGSKAQLAPYHNLTFTARQERKGAKDARGNKRERSAERMWEKVQDFSGRCSASSSWVRKASQQSSEVQLTKVPSHWVGVLLLELVLG